jgi:uncharacterized protein (DUF342 family)
MDGGLTLGITMTAIPEDASPETLAEMLTQELAARNIVFGLDQAEVLRVVRDRVIGQEVEIAHGTPPQPGRSAEVELLLTPPSFTHSADDSGKVDFKNIENVSHVKAGDVISRKTPSDPGQPGVNVFGKPVRPPLVRDARHPSGKNTAISTDGLEMTATADGFLRWNGDKIDVLELYTVKGNVDLRTGNIRYERDVEVLGDVKSGFEVAAGGSVHVYGTVEGGSVVSEGGTVTVNGGVLGTENQQASVTAEGDVQIGRARFARIQSKSGRVIANFAVEHCEVHAAGDLVLRAGPAMNCVIEVGGQVDVANVSTRQVLGVQAQQQAAIGQASRGNKRAYLRVRLSPPPAIQVQGSRPSDKFGGAIVDLSAGGALIKLPDVLREGDRHRAQFSLEGVQGTLWMDVEIVRVAAKGKTGNLYGIQFVQIEPAVRETIARFCLAEDLRQHRAARDAAAN